MKECECPEPNPKPKKPDTCVRCGFAISPRWATSDAHMMRFFNRLSDCRNLEASFPAFRQLCERREKAGRDTFRYAYLNRDDLSEGMEEAADLALYPYLDSLKMIREGREGEDYDLVLTVAFHAAQAFDALARLKEKRAGTP